MHIIHSAHWQGPKRKKKEKKEKEKENCPIWVSKKEINNSVNFQRRLAFCTCPSAKKIALQAGVEFASIPPAVQEMVGQNFVRKNRTVHLSTIEILTKNRSWHSYGEANKKKKKTCKHACLLFAFRLCHKLMNLRLVVVTATLLECNYCRLTK
jgi:hypothetical protein